MTGLNVKRTKIIIIGGFLGSGKTSLIKILAREYVSSGKKVAYLTNEAGEESVGGDVFGYDENAKEMTTACVTCNLKEVMMSAVEQLIEQAHPEILFIEPKDTISPLVVRNELERAFLKFESPLLFTPSATVIDCSRFFKNIKEKKKITLDQIMVSEIVLLNKTDLIKPKELSIIKESVRQINSNAEILESSIYKKENIQRMMDAFGV